MISIEQIPPHLVWPIRHEVMYPELDIEDIKLTEDEQGIHLGLFQENKLISVVSLFKNQNDMQFRKFATLKDFQGKGFGSQLLNFVIQQTKTEKCNRLWCNARKSASNFYSKFGFKETSTTFFKDGHDFVIMELIFDITPGQ